MVTTAVPSKRPPVGGRILVVGAGVVGVAIALELRKRGRDVVLLDRAEPGRGASFGNLASIAVSEFMPISRPSVWRDIPRWLMDREGPVRLRPAYLPRVAPWFFRFLRAGMPDRLPGLEAAGAALCARVYDDLTPLLEETGLTGALSSEGCLALYADDAEFARDREHLRVLERFEIPHELIGAAELRALEPALSTSITRAVLLPQNRSIDDPFKFVRALFARFLSMGGVFESGSAAGFETASERVQAIRLADGRRLATDEFVLCAGARTGRLSKLLGEAIPLETERGYHTQIMGSQVALRHSLIRPSKAFMVTPTAGGIRVGGTVEFAGLDAKPDFRRAEITAKRAAEVLPGLVLEEVSQWMGHRPALPDTIPIISRSITHAGVYYATGHGHLGLTLAATTARLMGDLITQSVPVLDMAPYSIERYARSPRR